jgi:hypothetical protein
MRTVHETAFALAFGCFGRKMGGMSSQAAELVAQVIVGLVIALVLEVRPHVDELMKLADAELKNQRHLGSRFVKIFTATYYGLLALSSALALAACLFSVIYDVEIGRWATAGIAITVIYQVYSVVVFPTIFFIVRLFSKEKTVRVFFLTTLCVTVVYVTLVAAIFAGVR